MIDEATFTTEPRRNISNLSPCKPYELEVYTLYQGRRSMNSQKAILFTSTQHFTFFFKLCALLQLEVMLIQHISFQLRSPHRAYCPPNSRRILFPCSGNHLSER